MWVMNSCHIQLQKPENSARTCSLQLCHSQCQRKVCTRALWPRMQHPAVPSLSLVFASQHIMGCCHPPAIPSLSLVLAPPSGMGCSQPSGKHALHAPPQSPHHLLLQGWLGAAWVAWMAWGPVAAGPTCSMGRMDSREVWVAHERRGGWCIHTWVACTHG